MCFFTTFPDSCSTINWRRESLVDFLKQIVHSIIYRRKKWSENKQKITDTPRQDETEYCALTTAGHQDRDVDITSPCLSPNPISGPIVDQDRPEWLAKSHKMRDTDVEDGLQTKDSLTHSHETQSLVPTSGPPIDPHDTREYIPACFTPVATLSQCTHGGRQYFDKHNDFGLDIPAGAIPEGDSITIDIGVALYGPFQYPKGLRPVSPIFWVCVRDQKDFRFLKPVKVTIPHCLNLKQYDDIESLGLNILKGDHEMNPQQMYQFQQEGNILIQPLKNSKYGVIESTHFCSRCISCKDTPEFYEKSSFCLCSVIPEQFFPGRDSHAFFFITLLLPTCLTTVENQIKELGYKEKQKTEFQIGSDQTLKICLPQSKRAGWHIGMRGEVQVI